MTKRDMPFLKRLAPEALLFALLTVSAHAQAPTSQPPSAARCAALGDALDYAIFQLQGEERMQDGQTARNEGRELCATGDYAGGMQKLVQGFVYLRVKPPPGY